MAKLYQYFVEGECEEKLINIYKAPPYNYFVPGKVEVFNFVNKFITKNRILNLKPETNIILIYDTDVEDIERLRANIDMLRKYGYKNIYHIQSIKTFEDEIVFSTDMKKIDELFNTKSNSEFKTQFLREKELNLVNRLEKHYFSLDDIWTRSSNDKIFRQYSSDLSAGFIRQKNRLIAREK